MLILERRVNDTVCIGNDIRIKVVAIPGRNRVRIGLDVEPGIPIWREDEAQQAAARMRSPQQPDSDNEQLNNSLHALLVEDDTAHAQFILKALGNAKWVHTTLVQTGEAALAYLQDPHNREHHRVDLILLDLRLPGIDGFETLKAIKHDEHLRTIPVVMLSSSTDDDDVSSCLDAGANAFITKAHDYAELCRSMLRIVNFWRHTQRPLV